MKGVVIEKTGGTEVLQYKTDIPVPELKDGEVLVKNEYIVSSFTIRRVDKTSPWFSFSFFASFMMMVDGSVCINNVY
jgi:hypothetical protein